MLFKTKAVKYLNATLLLVWHYYISHSITYRRQQNVEDGQLEESLFIMELGIRSPMLKVLDFLIDNESFDYSKTDIADGTGLSRATLFKAWPKLAALDLITSTRSVG
jgi:CRP-like cAMP-binding protein